MLLRVLLVLAVAAVLFTWWTRRRTPPPPPAPPPTTPGREAMLRCPHCGVHTPASLGWPGRGGTYCSAEHRAAHEPHEPGAS
jgi:uncharacterized protein